MTSCARTSSPHGKDTCLKNTARIRAVFFDIKKRISFKFDISITNIYIVGSGQLGFSLNPEKEYHDFRYEETDECYKASDLDFAIISNKLFDMIWDELCGFRLGECSFNDKERNEFRDFEKYLFKGWIRPDKFPFDFSMKKEWFEFFNTLNALVNRKVNCGVFRNETSFLKQYTRSINDLIKIIKAEKVA